MSTIVFPRNTISAQIDELVAFPGAEGFGRFASGGRGGDVYVVTNTNDSGSGSLRECVEASGARTCVFAVGGTISLASNLTISNNDITIAGQTAPEGGITLTGATLIVTADNVIIRYIRTRTGDATPDPNNGDGIRVNGAENVIIDHSSFAWATDENTSIVNSSNVTYQWNIISEGLYNSTHEESPHSMGMLISSTTSNVSVHHNLFAHNHLRNPQVAHADPMEFINNVIYNYDQGVRTNAGDGAIVNLDIVKNYFVAGVNTSISRPSIDNLSTGTVSFYVEGNIDQLRTDDSQANSLSVHPSHTGLMSGDRIITNTSVSETSALQAYYDVLEFAGANVPEYDSVDTRIIQEVKDLSGAFVDSQDDVGGLPTLSSGTAPVDSDGDGMPDNWEDDYGFDKNDPSDRNNDADGDGYTNLEEYLNFTQPINISSWVQTDWSGETAQTNWQSIRHWSSKSGVNHGTPGQLTLDNPEEFTNVGFNINTNNWSGVVEVEAVEPDEISNLALWLKADAITGLNNNDMVATWSDSSVNVNNATQTTDDLKPLYQTDQVNGLPALLWDNNNDYFNFTPITAATFDMFAVFKRDSGAADLDTLLGSNSSTTFIRKLNSGNNWDSRGDNSGISTTSNSVSLNGNWRIGNFNFRDNTFQLRMNGRFRGTSSQTNSAYTLRRIGARGSSEVWNGHIAEMIIFNQRLAEVERLQIEKYLSQKYDISVLQGLQLSRNSSNAIETSLSVGSGTLTAPEGNSVIGQLLNLGDTRTYTLTGHAKTDGSAVTSDDVELYAQGSPLTTTFTSVGNGWYEMEATVSGTSSNAYYGAEIKAGKTVYIDKMSLKAFASVGTLTSSIFDSGDSSNWNVLTYSADTPLDSGLSVRVRTGQQADLSDASDFSVCNAIASGVDISGNNCVSDGDRYAQYQVTMTPSSNPHSPTLESFSLLFSEYIPGEDSSSDSGSSSSSNSSSSSGSRNNSAPVCNDTPPHAAPDLFQIVSNSTSATVYFTPVRDHNSAYFLSYSTNPSAEEHGALLFLGNDGVQSYTVEYLSPKTEYYFKVRGNNGCAPGPWSSIKKSKTLRFSSRTVVNPSVPVETSLVDTIVSPQPTPQPTLPVVPAKSASDSPQVVEETERFEEPKVATVKSYKLSIFVHDKGKPLPGAEVKLHSGSMFETTNADGFVSFANVAAGEQTINVRYDNQNVEQKILVQGNSKEFNYSVEINVEPKLPFWKRIIQQIQNWFKALFS